MPRPTPEQLARINKFTARELTEEEVYVFPNMMIDDQVTSYSSKLHPNLLRKFVKDANRGVGLLMNHNSRSLPVGRSFGADIREEFDEEYGYTQSVYGQFYIDLGRQTESGMSTDDLVKGIDAGTIFDTSIGFNAATWNCSLCNHDIRDYMNCSHYPGEQYEIKGDDGVFRTETCYVIAGEDGDGELLENSLVYAGACNRATIKNNFSRGESVSGESKGSKLHLVENFKNIPLNATITQYYTRDGSVLFTDSADRTNGAEYLKQRSESEVEFAKLQAMFSQVGVEITETQTPDELTAKVKEAFAAKDAQVGTLTADLESVRGELATAATNLEAEKQLSATKDVTIEELTRTNEELTEKAELANTYRQDLSEQALDLGVRAQGNAFNKTMYEKFLGTLSVAEIKEVIQGFEAEVNTRFAGARITDGSVGGEQRLNNGQPKSREDFETETEFRNFVADEATKYAKEQGVSITDATKLMFKKYSNADGSAE
ncbi:MULTISPECIES: hypothetical protein [unclassified Paenibacillus]|uniref:hypothetical protein n=1 Tax=unclassified Paenibacillus TaxID=185978 RepID=UPI0008972541|nr:MULTISPECIES: hypothetical protein [unclassified Paenibacillus]OMC68660.1 hypothetical protein BK126_12595 [Paenibacillus sp. FSL H7-0326]SDW55904.1 hypothetical protein SAMN05518848_102174 [Paenibacillus sp. PDC88]